MFFDDDEIWWCRDVIEVVKNGQKSRCQKRGQKSAIFRDFHDFDVCCWFDKIDDEIGVMTWSLWYDEFIDLRSKKRHVKNGPFLGVEKKSPKNRRFLTTKSGERERSHVVTKWSAFLWRWDRGRKSWSAATTPPGIAERHLECPAGIREVLEPSAQHYF